MFFVNNQAFAAGSNIMYSKKDCENLGTTWEKGTLEYGCSIFLYEDGRDLIQWVSGVELGEKYIPTGSKILVYNFYSTNNNNKMPSRCADGFRQGEFKGWNGCIRDSNKSATGLPKESLGKDWTENKCKDSGGVWHNRAGDVLGCVFSTGGERVTLQKGLAEYLGASGYYYSSNNTRTPEKFYPDGTKCPSGYSKKEEKKDGKTSTVCVKNGSEDPNANNDDDGDGIKNSDDEDYIPSTQSGNSETSCAIDSVGWIVCPTTNFLTEAVVSTYQYIANNFLSIKSNELFSETEESGQSVKKAWDGFRDIANIAFAILFVIVVLSQVTNIGISNYGIKKLLPRLLIFAILINISYWVSVIFVDLSNIIGKWIFNFLSEGSSDAHISNLSGTIRTILAGSAAAASVGMAGGIFLSVVAALVAILLMVAILTIRQAAVVILIVLSPLAFAAAILPGTESLFSKWKNTLKSMLIIFPVCSLIMGGMLKASEILVKTADRNPILEALYTLLPLIGLGSVFVAIKGALAAIDKLTGGSITGKLSSMASGLNKAAEKSPIGSLDKGINSRIAAKYQQFGGGKLSRRSNRFAKAGEESRARALRDAQISDYEKMGSLNSGQELHLSKLRSDRQKEADLLTSSRSLALSNEIGSKSGEYISKAEAALNRQDGEELGVILDSIMTNPRLSGKDRMAKISEIISKMSAEQASSGAVQKAMATFAGKHGGNIKKDDPALLKTVGSLADGAKQSGAEIYQEHASNVETYKDASQSDAAGWNTQTLANIEKYKSGWSVHDAEVVGAKSAAVLGDERLRHSISEAQREFHQKIATDAGLKISHDDNTNNAQADIAQALKDLNSTIQQQSQQPTQQRQAPQPRGPRRWR